MKLTNYVANTNSIKFAVALNPTGTAREVIAARYRGATNEQGTIQKVFPGDYVFEIEIDLNGDPAPQYHVYRFYDGKLEKLEGEAMRDAFALLKTNKLANEYISDNYPRYIGDYLNRRFLPDGLGWSDGESVGILRKKRIYKRFFKSLTDQEWDRVWPYVKNTDTGLISMDWGAVKPSLQKEELLRAAQRAVKSDDSFFIVADRTFRYSIVDSLNDIKKAVRIITVNPIQSASGTSYCTWTLFRI